MCRTQDGYLQVAGAHFAFDVVHVQDTAPPETAPVKTTVMSTALVLATLPRTEMVGAVPLPSVNVALVARPLAVKGQAAEIPDAVELADTFSVTQVRKPLAAKMISEAFARFV